MFDEVRDSLKRLEEGLREERRRLEDRATTATEIANRASLAAAEAETKCDEAFALLREGALEYRDTGALCTEEPDTVFGEGTCWGCRAWSLVGREAGGRVAALEAEQRRVGVGGSAVAMPGTCPGTCPGNPRKKWFGLVNYEGGHEWDEHGLWRAADSTYMLVMGCRLCGSRKDFLLKDEDMLRLGFDLEKVRTLESMVGKPVPVGELDKYRQSFKEENEP